MDTDRAKLGLTIVLYSLQQFDVAHSRISGKTFEEIAVCVHVTKKERERERGGGGGG